MNTTTKRRIVDLQIRLNSLVDGSYARIIHYKHRTR